MSIRPHTAHAINSTEHHRSIVTPLPPPIRSRNHPTNTAAGIAVTFPHCRRLEKYLPLIRAGTTSAIQHVHAGLPTAPTAYMMKTIHKNTVSDDPAPPHPPLLTIQTGTSPIPTHIARCT